MLSTVHIVKGTLQQLKDITGPRFAQLLVCMKKKVFLILTTSHISVMIKMIV